MAEDYQNPDIMKVTVKIEKELYLFVTAQLYHGQLSKLIRSIFESVKMLILAGRIKEIILYASGQGELTLPKINNTKEDSSCL